MSKIVKIVDMYLLVMQMTAWGPLWLCCTGSAACLKAWVRVHSSLVKIKGRPCVMCCCVSRQEPFFTSVTSAPPVSHTLNKPYPLVGQEAMLWFRSCKTVYSAVQRLDSEQDEWVAARCRCFSLIIRLKMCTLVLVLYVQCFGNPVFIVIFLFHFPWTFAQDLI